MSDVSQIMADIEAWLDKATPGEWRAGDGVFGKNVVLVAGSVDTCSGATVWGEMARVTLRFAQDADGREWHADGTAEANTAYIAACSPDRIRALLDEVTRLREERDAANEALRTISVTLGGSDEWSDQRQMILDVHRQVAEATHALTAEATRCGEAEALLREAGEVMRCIDFGRFPTREEVAHARAFLSKLEKTDADQ